MIVEPNWTRLQSWGCPELKHKSSDDFALSTVKPEGLKNDIESSSVGKQEVQIPETGVFEVSPEANEIQ